MVDAEGPGRTYVVKSGQGLDAVARELDTTREVLAAANGLKPPYNLQQGQRLKGPPTSAKAYVVVSGDTLFAVARRFNVTPAAIASRNSIRINDPIRPNQRLLLPSGYRDTGPGMVAQAPADPTPQRSTPPSPALVQPPPSTTQYARPPQTPPASPPATSLITPNVRPPAAPVAPTAPAIIESGPTSSAGQIRAAGAGRFIWPLRGPILDAFGPKPGNQKNDGVNIGASMNQSVRAAAGGEVVYAGSEVPEFGNLVLIRHDNGFVTAYGHLARVLVRIQERVTQNQEIGEAGQSGGVNQPQLHFEVRYAARASDRPLPVDPMLVLPE